MWADDTWLQQHAGETLKDKESNDVKEEADAEGKGDKRPAEEAEVGLELPILIVDLCAFVCDFHFVTMFCTL